MGSVSCKVDFGRALEKLNSNSIRKGRMNLANKAHRDMNENYVPMKSQYLRDQSFVESDGSQITWVARYAAAQYNGGFITKSGKSVVFSNYTTRGTGPFWDDVAIPVFMTSWLEAFKKGADW
ncbi:hypothetical protein A5886_001806 [Enterococcus sp. 8G7_MSG3316]|uniref:Minor capsid protein n=1 Tax=Candidatus Enterococcus testudinis TaxID=1834191 RepID=A0A242A6Q8_9ENTE|nr:minor capsid protein [Enterococcus sp. 8G7_MSG3316]OTN76727.1 hypothetical protein A5886_001806 [Enterococcus sp. 8G7_MSG3316]